ncbi:MAG: bifunctional precorrin-2 dehydrogenase/sirohydrochlorin ferrochelatase [Desulfobacterales bacterium]
MRYYPVNLDISGRACLVVGGGAVATRKVLRLLQCGARVSVVSPEFTPTLEERAKGGELVLLRRGYRSEDLAEMFLVIGATNDEALNRRIHRDAEARGQLCNIADRPKVCNFILPAIVSRGDLVLAISTAGKSPALAKKLRRELADQIGPEYGPLLDLMGAVRRKLLAREHAPEEHKPLFEALLKRGLAALVAQGDIAAIDALLADVLGPGFTWDAFMPPSGEPGSEPTPE